MWEYAILDEVTISDVTQSVIIHADSSGVAKGYLRVECEGQLNQNAVGTGDSPNIIYRIDNNIAIMMYSEIEWDAEDPLFEWTSRIPSKMEEIQKAIAIWNDEFETVDYPKDEEGKIQTLLKEQQDKLWTDILGARMKSVEWVVEGDFTKPIYEANKVTQVLSLAGADAWELVGNIPGGDKRMLRRKK